MIPRTLGTTRSSASPVASNAATSAIVAIDGETSRSALVGDSLVAWEPRLKPGLQMLCQRLACTIGPVRQIEAIVIDSSSFNKINESGMYRLSFALKNTGAVSVAMPSLEVTLTDTQDQPVLRRVLSPVQLGAANNMLGASAEFSGA